MSDNQPSQLISPSNLQTVVAVCFVLSLLAVSFNFYNFTRINELFNGTMLIQNANVSGTNTANQAQNNRIIALEAKLAKLEKKLARRSANTGGDAPTAKGKGKKGQ